jgi:integrase
MKMRRNHVVPLSRQTLAILEKLKTETGKQEFIFHSPSNKTKYLSGGAVLGALRRMGYGGRMTGHGFRALASTILNEQRVYHPDVIEKQLAHADTDEVRAAYNRAEYILERKAMMQDWADFLDRSLKSENNVVEADFHQSGKREASNVSSIGMK